MIPDKCVQPSKILFILLSLLCTTDASAFLFGRPIATDIEKSAAPAQNQTLLEVRPKYKTILLMNPVLTAQEKNVLRTTSPLRPAAIYSDTTLPTSVQLGMNGVPVFDQGMHGTCVTFAAAAALNAALNRGDYISPLCSLELGSYLAPLGYIPDGWDNALAGWVLDQIMRFGIVDKQTQLTLGCSGIKEYPVNNPASRGNPISPEAYRKMSESLIGKIYINQLMSVEQRLGAPFMGEVIAEKTLARIKEALVNGNRVMFLTFVILTPNCQAGACATHHQHQDTWALTHELSQPPFKTGGHEMIITGYNDNSTATDNEGKMHKGLLHLRNSWGKDVGDQGDFYMTYDYFRKFAADAHEIGTVTLFF